jgi:hypothetical protein
MMIICNDEIASSKDAAGAGSLSSDSTDNNNDSMLNASRRNAFRGHLIIAVHFYRVDITHAMYGPW